MGIILEVGGGRGRGGRWRGYRWEVASGRVGKLCNVLGGKLGSRPYFTLTSTLRLLSA